MKTLELREFYHVISKLNNSFTHYFFVWTQFTIDYNNDLERQPEVITEDYFKGNTYAPKHSVKLKELKNEHTKTNSTLIDGIYVLMLSYFEEYLKDVFELARKVDKSIIQLDQNGNFVEDTLLIDKIINRIGIDQFNIDRSILDTYDYLRLKRNRLIHKSSDNISKTIRDLIKQKGKYLNEVWNKTLPKRLQGIDFSSQENLNKISFDILIDAMNILRGISAKLDTAIINRLSVQEFLKKEILISFLSDNRKGNESLADAKTKRKFVGYCRTKYGFEPDGVLLQNVIDDIA